MSRALRGTEARKYTELPITCLLLGRTSRTGRFIAKSYMIPLCMRNTRRLQVFGCEQSSHLGPVHGPAGSSQRAPNRKSRHQISSTLSSRPETAPQPDIPFAPNYNPAPGEISDGFFSRIDAAHGRADGCTTSLGVSRSSFRASKV